MYNIFHRHCFHTLPWILTSFLFPYILHSSYLTLLPGRKKNHWMKLIWSLCGMFLIFQREQCNITSWKIPCLALQLACIYLLLASNLPTRFTCTNVSKCFCISSLLFPRSSVFTPFQWFTPCFQNPSQLPSSQLTSIMQYQRPNSADWSRTVA